MTGKSEMSNQTPGKLIELSERLSPRYRKVLGLLAQLGLVVVSYVATFIFLWDFDLSQVPFDVLLKTLPLLIVVRLGALVVFRLYQGLWRYVSVPDLLDIIKATTAGSVVFAVIGIPIFGQQDFHGSVALVDWMGNIIVLSGVRLGVRLVREQFWPMRARDPSYQRMLIVGAGDAGAELCKQALGSRSFRSKPVAFVDDDSTKVGSSIMGIPIAGRFRDMPRVVETYNVDTAVIANPSASPSESRALVQICQQAGVPFKILPATTDLLDGTVSMAHIREVDPIDLLGRPPARLDRVVMQDFIRGKRILVTDAAGSVGSELSRQIARLQPNLLLLIDHAENPLLFLEAELRSTFPDISLVAQVVDITDQVEMAGLMSEFRPQVVFHAAAHKHVPLMERTPREAVKNNVGGTYVVAKCAQDAGVETFVLVSTDKAVKPTSVMGATKRLAELLTQEMDGQCPTRFISVRFGNVLGSNTSVVPIFKQQIANGGPVTVTHPDAQRYFMSIAEAAGLILQAASVGSGGETFVLDMGEPVKIVALAETLITLSGLKPYEDIDVVFTSLRPGEKLSEELESNEGKLTPTRYEKLLVLKCSQPVKGVLAEVEEFLSELPRLEPTEVKYRLRGRVPEYQPASFLTDVVRNPNNVPK